MISLTYDVTALVTCAVTFGLSSPSQYPALRDFEPPEGDEADDKNHLQRRRERDAHCVRMLTAQMADRRRVRGKKLCTVLWSIPIGLGQTRAFECMSGAARVQTPQTDARALPNGSGSRASGAGCSARSMPPGPYLHVNGVSLRKRRGGCVRILNTGRHGWGIQMSVFETEKNDRK